jgi:hypothetical protein
MCPLLGSRFGSRGRLMVKPLRATLTLISGPERTSPSAGAVMTIDGASWARPLPAAKASRRPVARRASPDGQRYRDNNSSPLSAQLDRRSFPGSVSQRKGVPGLALKGDSAVGAYLDTKAAGVALPAEARGDDVAVRHPRQAPVVSAQGNGQQDAQRAGLKAPITTGRGIALLHHDSERHCYHTFATGARLSLETRRTAPRGQA